MSQSICEHWVTEKNIARFQERLMGKTDIIQRKMLETLLALERETLIANHSG